MSTVAGTITNPLEQIFVCTHPLTSYQEYICRRTWRTIKTNETVNINHIRKLIGRVKTIVVTTQQNLYKKTTNDLGRRSRKCLETLK